MDSVRGIELTELLVVHHELLSVLQSEGSLTSHQLEGHCGQSRATINRHLATLREAALVQTDTGEHTLTAFGALLLRELATFSEPLHVSAQLPIYRATGFVSGCV